jgi:hypothetical protein
MARLQVMNRFKPQVRMTLALLRWSLGWGRGGACSAGRIKSGENKHFTARLSLSGHCLSIFLAHP